MSACVIHMGHHNGPGMLHHDNDDRVPGFQSYSELWPDIREALSDQCPVRYISILLWHTHMAVEPEPHRHTSPSGPTHLAPLLMCGSPSLSQPKPCYELAIKPSHLGKNRAISPDLCVHPSISHSAQHSDPPPSQPGIHITLHPSTQQQPYPLSSLQHSLLTATRKVWRRKKTQQKFIGYLEIGVGSFRGNNTDLVVLLREKTLVELAVIRRSAAQSSWYQWMSCIVQRRPVRYNSIPSSWHTDPMRTDHLW